MAWNEPGKGGGDPWRSGGSGGPDMDESLRKLQQAIQRWFGGTGDDNPGAGFYGIVLGAVLAVWGLLGIYQLDEQERAVVLRLGAYHSLVGPGVHWNPPLVDQVMKENVTKYRLHTTTAQMLTQDENIVQVKLSVQYNIIDLRKFKLAARDPELSLQEATESALRHVVGSSTMDQVLTDGREKIAVDVQSRLQSYIDDYSTGIQVSKVNIEETEPPKEVQAAFDDVIKAREDEQRVQNEAESYANAIIPEARGKALRISQEATAYKEQVIARAQGEAGRFEALLAQYQLAPAVTRERLYIEAIEHVMARSAKVMVDVSGGDTMMYLPLDRLIQQALPTDPSLPSLSKSQLSEIATRVLEQLRAEESQSRRGVR